MDKVEFAGFVVGIVFRVVAVNHVAVSVLLEMDVPPGVGDLGVVVIIDLIGSQQRLVCLQPHGSPKMPPGAIHLLADGSDINPSLLGRPGMRSPGAKLLAARGGGQDEPQ